VVSVVVRLPHVRRETARNYLKAGAMCMAAVQMLKKALGLRKGVARITTVEETAAELRRIEMAHGWATEERFESGDGAGLTLRTDSEASPLGEADREREKLLEGFFGAPVGGANGGGEKSSLHSSMASVSSEDEQDEALSRVFSYEEQRLQRIQHAREHTHRWGYMEELQREYERARFDELVETEGRYRSGSDILDQMYAEIRAFGEAGTEDWCTSAEAALAHIRLRRETRARQLAAIFMPDPEVRDQALEWDTSESSGEDEDGGDLLCCSEQCELPRFEGVHPEMGVDMRACSVECYRE
jgi:hypothetical protein